MSGILWLNILWVKCGRVTWGNTLGKDGIRECRGAMWELGAGSATQIADCQVERCQLIAKWKGASSSVIEILYGPYLILEFLLQNGKD